MAQRDEQGVIDARMRKDLGHVLRKESMCTVRARSSYGWICASHFCVVGSARTRPMAETLPTWGTTPLLLPPLTSISCLWIFPCAKTRKGFCAMLWKNRKLNGMMELDQNPWNCDEGGGGVGLYRDVASHVGSIVDGAERRFSRTPSSSFSLSLSLSHFFQPVCFVFLWICVKHANGVYVCV